MLGRKQAELIGLMQELRLSDYGARDALAFQQCIHPKKYDEVKRKGERVIHGVMPVMGMGGVTPPGGMFTPTSISMTAKKIREQKAGECHTLAQLAADHLLNLKKAGKLPADTNIKIVTHEAKLGSHTLILLNYPLTDFSKPNLKGLKDQYLIIDPWAVAMGHDQTQGVFTLDEYPFKDMLLRLACKFDSTAPTPTPTLSSSTLKMQTIMTGAPPTPQAKAPPVAPPVSPTRSPGSSTPPPSPPPISPTSPERSFPSEEKIKKEAVTLSFNLLSKDPLHADKVIIFAEKIIDPSVQASLTTLVKIFPSAEKLSSVLSTLFQKGVTPELDAILKREKVSTDDLKIISKSAAILHTAFNSVGAKPVETSHLSRPRPGR